MTAATAAVYRLPDVGEGLTEAEVAAWRVAVGDVVAVNDVLLEIETAKSIVELPSPYAGVVDELLVPEGRTVPVGTPLVSVLPPGGDAGEPATGEPEHEPMLVGYGPRAETAQRRRRRRGVPARAPGSARRPLAKPPVRKLAKDLRVDLAEVPSDGVVTRADVEAYAAGRSTPAVRDPAEDEDVRVPVTGLRRATAEAVVHSAFTAPHATAWVTVDVSRTVALVDRLKVDPAWSDVHVSPLLLIARAVCLALRRTPELNASWAGEEIVLRRHVDLGIAASTPRGLVVPHVRGADRLSLHDLARALGTLVEAAREGTTAPADLASGSFTITNVGVFGVEGGTPILNPDESGILSVGAIARRPWVDDQDQVVPRWVCTLSLSFDHRVADGVHASHLLADVATILTEPEMALTF